MRINLPYLQHIAEQGVNVIKTRVTGKQNKQMNS